MKTGALRHPFGILGEGFNGVLQILVFQSTDEDVGDHAVLIQNDRIGVGVTTAERSVVNTVESFSVIHGKVDIGVTVILGNERRSGIGNGSRVDGNHVNCLGIVCGDPVEIRKLIDARATPCSPEVDHGDPSGGGGIDAFV